MNKRETRHVLPGVEGFRPYDLFMTENRGRVLVVDDEVRVREVVAAYLERDGFRVEQAHDAATARTALAESRPDLIVLDVMFPGSSGFDLLSEIRSIPVIMLTARSEEADRVLGLELGADDYVVKPFSPRELVARVRSVLRRTTQTASQPAMRFPGLEIEVASRTVIVNGVITDLTAREFDLLAFMASHPRQVFSRNQLLRQVWQSSSDWQDPATVTVHIRRLRSKIELDPRAPTRLATVWGVGYRFQP